MIRKPACTLSILSILTLLFTTSVFSQEIEQEENVIDWNQIHMVGISYQQSFKNLNEASGTDTEKLEYNIQSLGLNYGSFTGSRLGFYSDIYLLLPFQSKYESDSNESNSGFSLDYMGAVGWSLWAGPIGFLPYIGFHTQYTFLNRDPLDENQSNHMISVGMGAGIKFLIKLNEKNNIFTGIKGSLDTIEFTSASYDSREIQLRNKISYMVSLGYAYTAPTKKRVLQSYEDE
ncbi:MULTISPECIES: hypothetical protein [unclassified Oceanispirochaeta]|uniref:hypothetical protein n=1 Tax=unclassified Oceanispirochaeta TaxID=2635722 RepID=UPI000E093F43|nr:MULTISPECIES: hypothetical protein [unclassified Oceanispirochaeta]MBF9015094.1 hypothetical protein [Oceanispirochaeta sp. M2]NPD71552.1 hypothetical protein [Oceanispirochaeta sp. M1]RDG33122.1 hypothetical protein DV872_05505 [Oceanispirochaeta sp. M1]